MADPSVQTPRAMNRTHLHRGAPRLPFRIHIGRNTYNVFATDPEAAKQEALTRLQNGGRVLGGDRLHTVPAEQPGVVIVTGVTNQNSKTYFPKWDRENGGGR